MTSCPNCALELPGDARFCPSCGTSIASADASGDALLGRTLNNKYRVLSILGRGSMGTVYSAEHIGLQKKIALKVLRPDLDVSEEILQRFQREGIAAGKFSHPNAIQIFDFDRAADRLFYLAMELVEARNLREFLTDKERASPHDALLITRQVLAALDEAHRHGIVHRDLKPENIMIAHEEGGQLTVKVLDFGLSKLVNIPLGVSMQTQMGRVLGTPMYMAPEQGAGKEVDHRSDLYAVGLILYELLTGVPPYQGDNLTELFVKKATEPAPRLVDEHPDLGLSADLDALLAGALAKEQEARFQSASEMLELLEQVDLAAAPGSPSKKARTRTGARPGGSPRWMLPLVAGVAVATLGYGAFWMVTRPGSPLLGGATRVSAKAADTRSPTEQQYIGLLDEARRHLRRGNTDSALSALSEAAALECADSEVYLLRGRVYRARDDDDTALADLQEALRLDPKFAAAAAEIGWLELERFDRTAASAAFETAHEIDPDWPDTLTGRAALLLGDGNSAEALALLERASSSAPSDVRAALYQGRALQAEGEPERAIEAFIRAKRNAPRDWRPYAALGELYLQTGRIDDAETQFSEALDRDADAESALLGLATILGDAGRTAELIQLAKPALSRHPNWRDVRFLLAVAYEAEGDSERAIAELEQVVVPSGGLAPAHALLGMLYQQGERFGEALEQYDAALAIEAETAKVHLDRGLCLFRLERIEQARDALLEAVRLESGLSYAHYALGILYMDYLGDKERALDHLSTYRLLDGGDRRVDAWIDRMSQ